MTTLFGTDGIRGLAGEPPLDAATLRALGVALARVLAADLAHPARVVIGRDTRESGPRIAADLAGGLREAGAIVRSAGVIPTPGISFLARSADFDAGIVVSASHNPWPDNGIKVFSSAGTKLADALEARVEAEVREAPLTSPDPPGALVDDPSLAPRHADWLVTRGLAAGGLDGLHVVVDCANGAAAGLAGDVLLRLSARADVRSDRPDGRNINEDCGSLHLEALARDVVATGADLGVAFDGDADRALFVTHRGETIDGDQILLVAAEALRAHGTLRGGAVVGTVMSNLGLERALAAMGLALLRERVGDRHVLGRMIESGCNLGGEQSGHVIFLDEAPTGDGLLTAIQVMSAVRRSGGSLAALAAGMQRSPQILRNVRVKAKVPLDTVDGHALLVRTWENRLGREGRILVRYSGTEPLVRVMAEGTDPALIEECVESIAGNLARSVGKIP